MKQIIYNSHICLLSIAILLTACNKNEPTEDINGPMRIKQSIEYKADLPSNKTIYYYEDNKIKTIFEYTYSDNETWEYTKKTEINYPEVNKIELIEFEYTDIWNEKIKTLITIENSYRKEVLEYKSINNIWEPSWSWEYEYNNEKVSKETMYIHIVDSTQKARITEYFWDEEKAFYTNVYIPEYSNFLLHRSDTIFYDGNNDTLHLYYDLLSNNPAQKVAKLYSEKRITSASFYLYSSNTWFEFMTLTYYYNINEKLETENKLYFGVESYFEYSYEQGSGNISILNNVTNWPSLFLYPE